MSSPVDEVKTGSVPGKKVTPLSRTAVDAKFMCALSFDVTEQPRSDYFKMVSDNVGQS